MNEPTIEYTGEDTEIFDYKGRRIETDRKDDHTYENVLPIFPGSGVHYIIDHMIVQEGDKVLDLGTGSGVLGIYAADKASQVIGTDVSERSLRFAEENAERNNVDNIEFRKGDCYEPVEGMEFDYIVTNPPFVPNPSNLKVALHTDGGPDGFSLTERIIQQAPQYLKDGGRMQMYSLTLGSEETSHLEGLVRENFEESEIIMTSMYSEPFPIEKFAEGMPGSEEWLERMHDRGFTNLNSYIVEIDSGSESGLVKKVIPESERDDFPDEWPNWKERWTDWILES